MELAERLERAGNVAEIFEIVKDAVRATLNRERAGLMLGLSEMGIMPDGFVGAYHPVGSNVIVMNRTILERIAKADPSLVKPYTFHILLHEYLHTLGVLDEARTRMLTYAVCSENFGEEHMVTRFSKDLESLLPRVLGRVPMEGNPLEVTLVEGFERDTDYIG
jgi:predicted Zn-dependent protease with MMP-like domain